MVMIVPGSNTHYLERLGSDHRPVFSNMRVHNHKRIGRFVFDKIWSSNEEVDTIINNHWTMGVSSSNQSVSDRIVSCHKDLSK